MDFPVKSDWVIMRNENSAHAQKIGVVIRAADRKEWGFWGREWLEGEGAHICGGGGGGDLKPDVFF